MRPFDLQRRDLVASSKDLQKGHVIPGGTLADILVALDTHVGTPEDVIESLSRDTTLPRVTDLVFQVHSVDPPHRLILRSIELIAEEVAPALGWNNPIAKARKTRSARSLNEPKHASDRK